METHVTTNVGTPESAALGTLKVESSAGAVVVQTDRLANLVERVDNLVGALEAKIGLVLAPVEPLSPTATLGEMAHIEESTHAANLRTSNNRLEDICMALDQIHNRVEL